LATSRLITPAIAAGSSRRIFRGSGVVTLIRLFLFVAGG
jgi:hypothetical protein